MRKVRGALLALALVCTGMIAGAPRAMAAGNYTVSINDASSTEGNPVPFVVRVTPTPASGDVITVQADTSDGTATGGAACPAADYFTQTATIVLTSGTPTRPFNVQTCDDAVQESAETLFVDLSNRQITCNNAIPSCTVVFGDATGLGTINDNEPVPTATPTPSPTPSPAPVLQPATLAALDAVGRAGPGDNCRFNVNREGDPSTLVRVNFASTGKPSRVANVAGTLVFAPGETTKTVDVDVLRRPRRQKFVTLTLSNAVGALITDATALCELKTKHKR